MAPNPPQSRKTPANPLDVPQEGKHDQQLAENIEFLDLREPDRKLAVHQPRDNGAEHEQRQRQSNPREAHLLPGKEQRGERQP
jgi:hypothetical protein